MIELLINKGNKMAKINKSFVIQQQLNAYKSKFTHPFTINDTFVDIEEMGANYPDELVPLVDIAEGVKILIQHKIQTPLLNKYASYDFNCARGELVDINLLRSLWMFQRNTYISNVVNIHSSWFEPCARSGKGVRLPKKYGSLVLVADSGHTTITRIIRGETQIPFEIADIPDQGNYHDTLQLAVEVAGEIFLSLNNKTVKRPNKFDIYRIAVVQHQEPEYSINSIINPLGFKVKQEPGGMRIHNLQDIHFLWKLDSRSDNKGLALQTALAWWKRNWPTDPVDPCLSASFGLLMNLETKRNKQPWTEKQEDQLATILKQRWNIIEFADDWIKESYSEVTNGEGIHDSNHQVMYGLAYIWNKFTNSNVPIPSGLDYSKAKNRVL
jgi:hypothetical protein